MRCSDELRERTVSQLGAGYARGLLGFDTLCRRVDRAYGARSVEQLRALVRDLPAPAGLARRLRDALRTLVGRDRDAAGEALLLSPPAPEPGASFVLGRGRSCDLVMEEETVSRRHAALRASGRGWIIADLGSMNGTWVNGWRVREPRVVEPGDAIHLGLMAWVFAPRSSPTRH